MSTDDPTVTVTDASGVEHRAFATSRIEGRNEGHTFPVIWISFERGGQSIPWPAEFVRAEESE